MLLENLEVLHKSFGKGSVVSVNGKYFTVKFDSVKEIGVAAFASCTALTTMSIPSKVTTVGQRAFADCVKLTKVSVPEGVTTMDYRVFEGCTALTEVACKAEVQPESWNVEWLGIESTTIAQFGK